MANEPNDGAKTLEKGLQCVGGLLVLVTIALYIRNFYERWLGGSPIAINDLDKLFLGAGLVLLLWPTLSSLKIANILEVSRLKEEVKEAKAVAQEAKEEAASKPSIVGQSARMAKPEAAKEAELSGKPGLAGIDPNFARFGRSRTSNDRYISAEVVPGDDPNWYKIKLRVRSTNPAAPIIGPVRFHLHPTFTPNEVTVMATNGEASLQIWAWGSFVVGAVLDNEQTRLEIDLGDAQQVPSAPEIFRSR